VSALSVDALCLLDVFHVTFRCARSGGCFA
jgi:hypothetical protein